MTTVRVPSRFNGPPASGHGGYSAGVVALALGEAPAAVSLRAPPPLDTDLEVVRVDGGIEVRDGDVLVATAQPAAPALAPPTALAPEEAAAAGKDPEEFAARHPFPTCFGCGPLREPGDGMRLFAGPVGDGRFADRWVPEGDGEVAPELVWAALDCPSCSPALDIIPPSTPIVLARFCVELEAPVRAGEPHAVVSRAAAHDGRKHHSAVALYDAAGQRVARADALWIALR